MDGELTYQAWATNYENELPKIKPCPFCGGEDVSVDAGYWDAHGARYEIGCENPQCEVHPCSDLFPTEAEAIEAWNNRAETVTVTTGITTVTDAPQITYVPERTCYDRNASAREHGAYLFMWRCSNCDESYDTEMGKLNFCPNCGARVTPKNSETTPKVVS